MISFQNRHKTKLPYSQVRLRNWLFYCVEEHHRKVGDINFVFDTDESVLEVNRIYLDHDYYTDIITFDNSDDSEVAADIIISLDRIKDNATELGVPFQIEFLRVCIHGVLHCIGFKDKTDEDVEAMRAEEDKCIELFHVKQF